jgi:HAD superfamily hydrolase (TIGR01490 family)
MNQDPRPLAIFDFDGTMIKGDSIVPYVQFALQKGKLSLPDALRAGLYSLLGISRLVSAEKGKSGVLRFLRHMSMEEQQAFNDAFLKERILPRLFPRAVKRLLHHRAQNDIILLVSASPDCYMRKLASFLPVHDILASRTSPEGVVSSNCKGEEKVRRVRAWAEQNHFDIDWAASFAYGDNASDIPVMSLTGNPVCVNPKKALSGQKPEWKAEQWGEINGSATL